MNGAAYMDFSDFVMLIEEICRDIFKEENYGIVDSIYGPLIIMSGMMLTTTSMLTISIKKMYQCYKKHGDMETVIRNTFCGIQTITKK